MINEKDIVKDAILKTDYSSESFGGATNAATALGNGRLSVGISPWGELVYFRWPTLSYYDHLYYITKAHGIGGVLFPRNMRWGETAPSKDWEYYGRPFEKDPHLGGKGELTFSNGTTSWLGDSNWKADRQYLSDSSPVLKTHLHSTNLACDVIVQQWVDWEWDLLVQLFFVDSPIGTNFKYYSSFNPSLSRDPYFGMPTYHPGDVTISLSSLSLQLFFRPKFGKYTEGLNTPEKVDINYPNGGIFIAQQIRSDISTPKQWLILTAIANSAQNAVRIINDASIYGPEKLCIRVEQAWQNKLKNLSIPSQSTSSESRVAFRSIMNLLLGCDRQTGAIVASLSRQPSYHYDWSRDGAFFDLALDLAGFQNIVTNHLNFYAKNQQKARWGWSPLWLLGGVSPIYHPIGHWSSNLSSDGSPGGLKIIPFEIDETALMIWDFWRHSLFLPNSDQSTYRKWAFPVIEKASDALLNYVDIKRGWVKRAFEDDNQVPNATLHGAAAVLTGLLAGVNASRNWHYPNCNQELWLQAAIELQKGILKKILCSEFLKSTGWRGLQWALFPAPLFSDYREPQASAIIEILLNDIRRKISKNQAGFAYLGEELYILNIVSGILGESPPLLQEALRILVDEIPVKGTDCYGEITVWLRGESYINNPVAQQRTSIPHLWTGITVYLAIEARYHPERFWSLIPKFYEV